ncbi:MAG: hypothetical protein ACT4PU_11240 [Planctomycetota bacterium]
MKTPTNRDIGVSIVLLGSFNPAILHPQWFSRMGLVAEAEADSAILKYCTTDQTAFDLDWCALNVEKERFQVIAGSIRNAGLLRDLVVGLLSKLAHTPIQHLGINHHMHFKMEHLDDWHKFGHVLAPKTSWNKVMSKPGLASLTVQGKRDGVDEMELFKVIVQPSVLLTPGVYIATNEQYSTAPGNSAAGAHQALTSHWPLAESRAMQVADTLFADFEGN